MPLARSQARQLQAARTGGRQSPERRSPERQPPERQPPVRAAPPSGELTRVGWMPRADIDLAEWSSVGRRFGEIGRCSQWWLGDWIHYGNERFGERYARAVKLTGYDVQSLMNMVYVASRFEISRRRETLSWSHHAALAALDRDAQDDWLERASAQRFSVADLRAELRSRRPELRSRRRELRAAGAERQLPADPTDEGTLLCPHCGGPVPVPA
jgi:hypothetical protein